MLDAKKRTKEESKILYDDYNNLNIENIGKDKNYLILTYGCQMNVHDSEYISGIMEDIGYTKVSDMDKADVIIINTCAIRENAHNKASGMLGRIKHLKETNENIKVIFCGCMAQETDVVNKFKDYKWIDIICGTHNYHKIPEYLYELMPRGDQFVNEVILANLPNWKRVNVLISHDLLIEPLVAYASNRTVDLKFYESGKWANYLSGMAVVVDEANLVTLLPVRGIELGYMYTEKHQATLDSLAALQNP